jgi:hypothetical protein
MSLSEYVKMKLDQEERNKAERDKPTHRLVIRADDAPWQAAQQRATREGTTVSALASEFVVAYAAG